MDEAIARVAAMTARRDIERKILLDPECDHQIFPMPVIDARFDYQCSRCAGIVSVTANRVQLLCGCGWRFNWASWDKASPTEDVLRMLLFHPRHLPVEDCGHSIGRISDSGDLDSDVCPECHGQGGLEGGRCLHCFGTGQVPTVICLVCNEELI